MKFAYHKIGNDEKRISIDEYQDEMLGAIFCAEGHHLIAKRGAVVSHHFAHKTSCDCCCSDNKGDWHISMQDRAKKEAQEIRMYNSLGKVVHIADVCIPFDPTVTISIDDSNKSKASVTNCKGYVVEYQHSPMDEKTMRERESFYTGLGYHLIWVFHAPSWEYKILKTNKDGTIQLKYRLGPKFPFLGSYKGKVSKILDFDKQLLLLVTDQLGTTITGKSLEMSDFDRLYMQGYSTGADTRPFHHPI